MAKYEITTEKGKYIVETADAPLSAGVPDNGIGTQVVQGATDLLRGIGSGVFSTVRGAAKLAGYQNPTLDALATAPKSAMGQAGNVIEQGAEFLIPGGAVARGTKLLEGGSKLAQFAGRVGLEALSAGAVAGVQSGGDPVAMRNAALMAGGTTAALGAASASAPKVANALKEGAARQYGRVLNPTTKAAKATAAKVIPELIDRGVSAASLPGMMARAESRVSSLGQKIDDVWDKMDVTGVTAKIDPLLQRLDDAAKQFYTTNAKGELIPMGGVAQSGLKELEGLGYTLLEAATKNPVDGSWEIPVKTLRELRQYWDEVAAASGAFTKSPKELASWTRGRAYQAGGNAIRAELAQASPDLAALNKEFSFWKRVGEVTESTMQRRVGQQKPLTRRLAQLGGAAAGGAAGGGIGAVIGSVALDQLQGAISSPAWGTVSAVLKDRLANALAKGSRGEVEFYLQKIAKSMGGAAVTPRSVPALQPAQ